MTVVAGEELIRKESDKAQVNITNPFPHTGSEGVLIKGMAEDAYDYGNYTSIQP